ncbi:hypothetical protein D3C87_1760500 [compost metagenome]
MADAKHIDNAVFIRPLRFFRSEPFAVVQVLGNAEVRKQPRFLKNITKMAPVRRQEQALSAIGQHFAIERYLTTIWPQQTCDDADHRRFTGAGASEKRCNAAIRGE